MTKRVLTLMGLMLLAGCDGERGIREVVTPSGVRCVTYWSKAISCDWNHAPEPRP